MLNFDDKHIEKRVELYWQKSMQKEGWETVGYEEFMGLDGPPRFVVMWLGIKCQLCGKQLKVWESVCKECLVPKE